MDSDSEKERARKRNFFLLPALCLSAYLCTARTSTHKDARALSLSLSLGPSSLGLKVDLSLKSNSSIHSVELEWRVVPPGSLPEEADVLEM